MTINGSTNHNLWTFKLEAIEGTPNIQNNTSPLTVTAYIGRGSSESYMRRPEASCVISVTGCNNKTIKYVPGIEVNVPANSYINIGSVTFDVPHDDDGSKTVNINAVLTNDVNPTYASANGNMKLTDIPRKAKIVAATNFNDEENPRITYSNPAGSSVTSLQLCISLTGANDDIEYRNISKTGTVCTFALSNDNREFLRNVAKNTNSLNVQFVLKTVIGNNTFYDSITKTMTIINANPEFTTFSYKDINSKVSNLLGNNQLLVKGLSNLEVTILANDKMIAKKEATPKNYIATIDNINKNIDYITTDIIETLGTINTFGTKKLSIRAYDSRNNSVLVEKDVFIYEYDKPVINSTIKRLNNFENETTLKVDGLFSSLIVDDAEKNGIVNAQYRYKEYNGDWKDWNDLTVTLEGNKYKCNDIILSLDNTKSFDFEVKVIDKLTENINILTVDVGKPIFFISSNERKCYINWEEIIPGG